MYMKFVMVGLEYTVLVITVLYGMNVLSLKIFIKLHGSKLANKPNKQIVNQKNKLNETKGLKVGGIPPKTMKKSSKANLEQELTITSHFSEVKGRNGIRQTTYIEQAITNSMCLKSKTVGVVFILK